MREFIQATPTKIEEKKNPETGVVSYRVVLEIVETLTVNSGVKLELNKSQLLEISRYNFEKDGKTIKGFKILGPAK